MDIEVAETSEIDLLQPVDCGIARGKRHSAKAQDAVLRNDEGCPVHLGDNLQILDGSSLYYCARVLGTAAIPGSDGQCGPNNGPQCASCQRLQMALLRYRFLVTQGKIIAGLIRFLFEDVLSGSLQMMYLCKLWLHISWGSRAFTMFSVAAGVFTSLLGPLQEYCNLRTIKSKLKDNVEQSLKRDGGQTHSQGLNGGHDAKVNKASLHKYRPMIAVVHDYSISGIVNGEAGHRSVRLVLVGAAAAFWASMAALPFLFPIKCGAGPKAIHHLVFFGLSMIIMLLETWISVQTKTGYLMFKHLRVKFVLGYLMGILGRFDTYSDVMFAGMIVSCDEITWFSIHGQKFYLPFGLDLARIVVFVLVVGVFCMQAVPGLALLAAWHDQLATGCKLNEYSVLLAVMDAEAHEDNDIRKKEEDNILAAAEAFAKYCTSSNEESETKVYW